MQNKITILKDMMDKLKSMDLSEYPEEQKLYEQIKDIVDRNKTFIDELSQIRAQLKVQYEKYCKESGDLLDKKIKEELGVDRHALEEALGEDEGSYDWDAVMHVWKQVMDHEYKKAPLFSKERGEIKESLSSVVKAEKSFNEMFELMKNIFNAIDVVIRLGRIAAGDFADVNELSDVPLIMNAEEKCFAAVGPVELYEDRAVRETAGGFGGFSFRVVKGISMRVGGFGAQGESHMEKRLIDKGKFYVTNERYVFDGSGKNIVGDLRKVIFVESYSDGIKISRSDKQRDEIYTGDQPWSLIGAVISGSIKRINQKK